MTTLQADFGHERQFHAPRPLLLPAGTGILVSRDEDYRLPGAVLKPTIPELDNGIDFLSTRHLNHF